MELGEIRELIRMLETSTLAELEIEEEGRRIRLSKSKGPEPSNAMPIFLTHGGTMALSQEAMQLPQSVPQAAPIVEESRADERLVTIDSPMVGTFYTCAAPGEPPFVVPGDTIEPDDTVCIVEAMKIMNEVAGKYHAVIEKVLVENGEPVEFGQPLFSVRRLD